LQRAASSLIARAGAEAVDPEAQATSLPQWVWRAQQRLALDAAQRRELRALVDENSGRLRFLQSGLAADPADDPLRRRRDAMADLRREFRDDLALILTGAQLAEWDALLEELLGEAHLRHLSRRGGTH
jgi:hypothetical protein